MPGLNRKGPNGEGAMSGRRMGQCSSNNKGKSVEEIIKERTTQVSSSDMEQPTPGNGYGLGRGAGMGRGMGLGRRAGGRNFGRGLGR